MKKIGALTAAVLTAFALTACGGSAEPAATVTTTVTTKPKAMSPQQKERNIVKLLNAATNVQSHEEWLKGLCTWKPGHDSVSPASYGGATNLLVYQCWQGSQRVGLAIAMPFASADGSGAGKKSTLPAITFATTTYIQGPGREWKPFASDNGEHMLFIDAKTFDATDF